MAQAAVDSALRGDSLTRRPSVLPRMKRKTPSELRVTPFLPPPMLLVSACSKDTACHIFVRFQHVPYHIVLILVAMLLESPSPLMLMDWLAISHWPSSKKTNEQVPLSWLFSSFT
jgi:hypothetical protein